VSFSCYDFKSVMKDRRWDSAWAVQQTLQKSFSWCCSGFYPLLTEVNRYELFTRTSKLWSEKQNSAQFEIYSGIHTEHINRDVLIFSNIPAAVQMIKLINCLGQTRVGLYHLVSRFSLFRSPLLSLRAINNQHIQKNNILDIWRHQPA